MILVVYYSQSEEVSLSIDSTWLFLYPELVSNPQTNVGQVGYKMRNGVTA